MVGLVRLMCACSAVTTCVWYAYGLLPSHFDCLPREGIKLTCMNGVRASALVFLSGGCVFKPPRGGQTVCPCALKDTLWWMNSLTTDHNLVTQHNNGSSMLVARALRWTIQGGRTFGGQTMGGENNHTPG